MGNVWQQFQTPADAVSEALDGYEGWTKDELQAELESRGLTKTGNKDELIARLNEDDKLKALWIDEGNDPDWAKCARYKMTALFFSMQDPRVTQAYLMDVRARGYTTGVYVAWNWAGYEGTGTEFAEKVSAKLGTIVPVTSAQNFPKVQLNVELHDPLYIQDMVVRWRQLRKYRDTSWTMEPMQGGWMSPNMVDAVTKSRVRVVPQCYWGNMAPADPTIVINNLVNQGFPRALVTPMYDAAALPTPWDGFAFTQGRLP